MDTIIITDPPYLRTTMIIPRCEIATVKPTIENVIPFSVYRKTQPRTLAQPMDPQSPVLLGGGRDFILTLLNAPNQQKLDSVDCFILNSCVVLWFDILGHGLSIPYTSIIYHAVETNHPGLVPQSTTPTSDDGHSLALIVTVERDEVLNQFFPMENGTVPKMDSEVIDSIEIVLYPKFSMYERHYSNQVETLFTFSNFGMNRGDDMIVNCHDALAQGMELHLDTFRDDPNETDDTETMAHLPENNAIYTGVGDFIQHTTFNNSGLADDLDNDQTFLDQVVNNVPHDAGMSLQFQLNDKLAGKKSGRRD